MLTIWLSASLCRLAPSMLTHAMPSMKTVISPGAMNNFREMRVLLRALDSDANMAFLMFWPGLTGAAALCVPGRFLVGYGDTVWPVSVTAWMP
jgi:hypothetical protein